MNQSAEWYFNPVIGEAEPGKRSPVDHRMGPYPSKDAALHAWDLVKKRNVTWEEADKKWSQSWEETEK